MTQTNVELLMERMALLSQRIETLQKRILEHRSKHYQTEDLEQTLLTLLATRSAYSDRLAQIDNTRYATPNGAAD